MIGCAMRVHSELGPGFREIIYQKALLIELKKEGLRALSEVDRPVHYKGVLIGRQRIDILVEDLILADLKAIVIPDPTTMNRVLNYLKVFGLEVGLYFNFGMGSLQYKRYVL